MHPSAAPTPPVRTPTSPHPDYCGSNAAGYRIAYDPAVPVVAGIFFETDDIPNRFYSDV